VFEMTNRDVDVSDDGEHWFHFSGSPCIGNLPAYNH
jgi:streptogramin lyase